MDELARLATLPTLRKQLVSEIGRVVVGQQDVVEHLLIALLSDGHALFVGVPGLAKTLLVQTLAAALGVASSRVQFTPDLMPSDVTGVEVLEEQADGTRAFRFVEGPVFTNLLLADEINRTPPKTQAALLQAMAERSVTVAGRTLALPTPFLVFATQNPIEQEGTYPLPEAQLDRFMMSIPVGYPSLEDEIAVVMRTTVGDRAEVRPVIDHQTLLEAVAVLRKLPANPDVVRYAVRLASASRPENGGRAAQQLRWGAGPRASQYLAIGARTRAALHGRELPNFEDVRAVAPAILRHRLVLNFEAEAQGVHTDQVIASLIDEVDG